MRDGMEAVAEAVTDPVSASLRQSYRDDSLIPLWESGTTGFARGAEAAMLWPWDRIGPVLRETADIRVPSILERRVLMMVNPTILRNDSEACAGLVSAGFQALMPGEVARPHRHAMHALRFVLEGEGAETIVEGKPCAMEPGDLVVTPGWTWHEHHNRGGRPTLWVDILDVALHRALKTDRFQPGPVAELRTVPSDAAFAAAGIVPVAIDGNEVTRNAHTPMFRYPAAQARAAVAAAPRDAAGLRIARYVDPRDGGAILPTIDCYMVGIDAGDSAPGESLGAQVCVVADGAGHTTIGDRTIAWTRNDVFTVPRGATVRHHVTEGPARLFVASDIEIYRRMGQLPPGARGLFG